MKNERPKAIRKPSNPIIAPKQIQEAVVVDGRCIIIGAGEFFGLKMLPEEGDLVIAADGGLDNLASGNNSIKPDILLGDFDSVNPDGEINFFNNKTVGLQTEIIPFPKEKDDTDMMLSVKEGYARGYRRFAIYGGTGDRPDHFVANLQTLVYLSRREARGWLFGKNYKITSVSNGKLNFNARESAVISVFAFDGKAEYVNLTGLKYAMSGGTIPTDFPIGVSNQAVGGLIEIEVGRGTLIVIAYD